MGKRGTHGKGSEHGNVTASSSLSLNHENTIPTSTSTLLDRVASVDEHVDTRIGSDTPLGDGNIVGNGGGKVNERDTKFRVLLTSSFEDLETDHTLETSDDEERVDLVFAELGSDAGEVSVGQSSVGSEFRSTTS